MDIGKQIKYHRELQNLSMQELSRRAAIAQSGISAIESGNRKPTVEVLEKIIQALNITWGDLFIDEPPTTSPLIREIMENIKSLSDSQIKTLNEFLKTLN